MQFKYTRARLYLIKSYFGSKSDRGGNIYLIIRNDVMQYNRDRGEDY